MKKAQLLTIDFILSLTIFVSILLTLITIWSTVDTQVRDVEGRRELQTLSVSVSDALVRSQGNPIDWNSTNANSIGFSTATERVLLLGKIREFLKMDYYSAKSKLRLGGVGPELYEPKAYEFQLFFTDTEGYNLTTGAARSPIAYYSKDPSKEKIWDNLTKAGVVWDFYWGRDNIPDKGTARFFYKQENNGIPESFRFFNTVLLGNESSYRTIIIEGFDPHEFGMKNSDLNISLLQKFVARGGILIIVGQGGDEGANIVDENFSVHAEFNINGWGEGNITNPWHMVPAELINKKVNFDDDGKWYFHSAPEDAKVNIIVSQNGFPDRGMICYWDYGFGRVYYIQDLDGTVDGGIPLFAAVASVGSQLKYGLSPSLPSQLVNVRRTAILEGFDREPVSMIMGVWR